MRFAFKTSPQNTTWPEILDVWRAADDIELFESGWTFDHFEPIFSDRTGPCMEGWITLTALAQATQRLRVGVLVTGNPYRHPSVLANMAASLDIISGGRLELGIGAGWNQDEADALGIDLPPLKERFDRFDEALEVITRLLRDEVADFDGVHYQLRQARCEPKPIQRPYPPIVIGGSGPTRTLRAVARHASHWNMAGGSLEDYARDKAILADHCAAIGRDPGEIMTSTHLRLDASTVDAIPSAVEDASRWAEAGLDLGIVYLPPPLSPAVLEPLADALAPLAG